jgi:hypothetical protein
MVPAAAPLPTGFAHLNAVPVRSFRTVLGEHDPHSLLPKRNSQSVERSRSFAELVEPDLERTAAAALGDGCRARPAVLGGTSRRTSSGWDPPRRAARVLIGLEVRGDALVVPAVDPRQWLGRALQRMRSRLEDQALHVVAAFAGGCVE